MARTTITAQALTPQGVTPTFEAANVDGHAVAIKAGRSIRFQNSTAGAINVTLITPLVLSGGVAVDDVVVSVPANGSIECGNLTGAFRQDDGTVHIDYATATGITVAAVDA